MKPMLRLMPFFLLAPMAWAADSMQAVVLNDGKLTVQTLPIPEPQSGQVRIRVRAASVNPVDWKLAERAAPGAHSIPGRDLAGIIDAVGPDAGHWHAGDEVIAVAAGGSYTEYALASVKAVAPKPARLSFAEAAGTPVVGETAWRAMVVVANVQPGQRVLIEGGAGGVGSSAVQIAKARGAYVIATASPTHDALLRSLGADQVIDYHDAHAEDGLHNLDVVLNTVDADTGSRAMSRLRPGGILVSVVGVPPAAPCAAAQIRCAITGSVTGEYLSALSALAAQGKFHVHIERRLPLAQAAAAWSLNRAGHTAGKIILEVSH